MVKIRLTYVQDSQEKEEIIGVLEENFNVINVSKEYRGRGNSKYSNIYVDVELKK